MPPKGIVLHGAGSTRPCRFSAIWARRSHPTCRPTTGARSDRSGSRGACSGLARSGRPFDGSGAGTVRVSDNPERLLRPVGGPDDSPTVRNIRRFWRRRGPREHKHPEFLPRYRRIPTRSPPPRSPSGPRSEGPLLRPSLSSVASPGRRSPRAPAPPTPDVSTWTSGTSARRRGTGTEAHAERVDRGRRRSARLETAWGDREGAGCGSRNARAHGDPNPSRLLLPRVRCRTPTTTPT